jgi:hypothetical protein
MSHKAAKADSNPSGIIKVNFDDVFASASWKKTRAKALAYDPLKGVKRIAKAPPSPNRGSKATERLAQRADFFVGKVDGKKVAAAKTNPKANHKPKKAKNVTVASGPHLDFFDSPAFKKSKRKALAYDPLKHARHIPKVPPASLSVHSAILKRSKQVKKNRMAQLKPQPSLVAAYESRPGQVPQFSPARVIKSQAQLNDLVRKGNLDLLSAIAYCDPRGAVHTGSVLEIYSMLPAA